MKKTWTVKWTVKFNALKPLALVAAGGLATQMASGQCVAPPPGIVAWWSGDGNAADIAGTNSGTLKNGATYAPGLVGQAFNFDGVDDCVEATTSELFNFNGGQGDFTIEAWIKPEDLRPCGFLAKATPSPYSGWSFGFTADGSLFFTGIGKWTAQTPPGAVQAGVWQHVAIARTGSSYRLFKNGIEVAAIAHSGNLETSTTALRIGTTYADWTQYRFAGLIDEPAIYNRALSSNEIATIYTAGSAGKCKSAPMSITTQPQSQVGYWGRDVVFSVAVTNATPPVGYQWRKDSTPLLDATNSTIFLTNLQSTNAGTYTVVVTDALTNLTSLPANLTVNPAGVGIALYAGVTIDGVTNQTYGVQSTLDLGNTNSWVGRANVTLTNATQLWYDSQPATQPQTYYRVVPGPISIP